MSPSSLPPGPTPEAIRTVILERYPETVEKPDFAAYDRLLPHPVYAKQLWISLLNPSDATFDDVVMPLIAETHDRLAATEARHRTATDGHDPTG